MRIVEIVDLLVAADHLDRELRIARAIGVEHVADHAWAISAIAGISVSGSILAGALELRDALGDVLGIVADALDHARNLERGDDFAQVVGHRRAQAR